jgi:hypothetical protein
MGNPGRTDSAGTGGSVSEAPACFVCARAMKLVRGTYAWRCYCCDVIEEHEEWVSRTETIPEAESEAFGVTRFLDHSAGHFPSPGLYSQVRQRCHWLSARILPDV